MENRFTDALEKDQAESGEGKSMDETLSEAGEEMEVGNTPDEGATNRYFSRGTARELLQDLSGDDWANKATPPFGSPRKNLELPLASESSNMGMVLLTNEVREKNTFEGNKGMFLSTLDEEAWQNFLSEFNQRVEKKTKVDGFKEELWDSGEVWRTRPDMQRTGRENEEGAASEDDWSEEAEAEYRGQPM